MNLCLLMDKAGAPSILDHLLLLLVRIQFPVQNLCCCPVPKAPHTTAFIPTNHLRTWEHIPHALRIPRLTTTTRLAWTGLDERPPFPISTTMFFLACPANEVIRQDARTISSTFSSWRGAVPTDLTIQCPGSVAIAADGVTRCLRRHHPTRPCYRPDYTMQLSRSCPHWLSDMQSKEGQVR